MSNNESVVLRWIGSEQSIAGTAHCTI